MNGNINMYELENQEAIIYADFINIAKLEFSEKNIYNIAFIISKDLVFKSKNKEHKITKLAFTEVTFLK